MTAEEKLACQRLNVLDLAQAPGNVSEACRQRGVSRTLFYEYKRRFQTYGLAGLLYIASINILHSFTRSLERRLYQYQVIATHVRVKRLVCHLYDITQKLVSTLATEDEGVF